MELEELKANWKSTNDRIDDMQAVQVAMQQTILAGQTRSAAGRLRIEPIIELIVGAVTVIWSGGFLADNFSKIAGAPASAIPAVSIYALGIFTIWLSIRQLLMLAGLNYANPIVETQKKIARIRALRVRSTQLAMLAGIPLWVVFPLFAGQALIRYEFVQAVDVNWIIANLAFGAIGSLGIVLAARKYGEQSPFFKRINDVFAGTEMASAQRMLAEVGDFERAR